MGKPGSFTSKTSTATSPSREGESAGTTKTHDNSPKYPKRPENNGSAPQSQDNGSNKLNTALDKSTRTRQHETRQFSWSDTESSVTKIVTRSTSL